MPDNNNPDWDGSWEASDIPYGEPYLGDSKKSPMGENKDSSMRGRKDYDRNIMAGFNSKYGEGSKQSIKKQKQINAYYKQQEKNQKRARRQATRNMISSKLISVLIGIAVVAVIIYKLVNGIELVGPDVDNLPDFRKL